MFGAKKEAFIPTYQLCRLLVPHHFSSRCSPKVALVAIVYSEVSVTSGISDRSSASQFERLRRVLLTIKLVKAMAEMREIGNTTAVILCCPIQAPSVSLSSEPISIPSLQSRMVLSSKRRFFAPPNSILLSVIMQLLPDVGVSQVSTTLTQNGMPPFSFAAAESFVNSPSLSNSPEVESQVCDSNGVPLKFLLLGMSSNLTLYAPPPVALTWASCLGALWMLQTVHVLK